MIGPAIICDHEGCDAFRLLGEPDEFEISVIRKRNMATMDLGWLDYPDGWRVGVKPEEGDYCPLHRGDAPEGEPSEFELSLSEDDPTRYLLAGLPAWARQHRQLRAVVEQIDGVVKAEYARAQIISTLKHFDELESMSRAARG